MNDKSMNKQEQHDHQLRFDATFNAALTGLLAGDSKWKIDGKKARSSDEYVELAKTFARIYTDGG